MTATRTTGRGQPGGLSLPERLLWRAGWHPVASVFVGGFAGLALGNAIAVPAALLANVGAFAAMSGLTVLGLALGLLAWFAGTKVVNARYDRVVPSATDETDYRLVAGDGSAPLVAAPETCSVTDVTLDDDAVRFDQQGIEMDDRSAVGEGRTVTVAYDDFARVAVGGDALAVETTTDSYRFSADEGAEEVADAIRDRAGENGGAGA